MKKTNIGFGKEIVNLQKALPAWNSKTAAKQIHNYLDALPQEHIKLMSKYSIDTYQDFEDAGHSTAAGWYDEYTKVVHIRWDAASRHALYHEIGHAVYYTLPRKEMDMWYSWWEQAKMDMMKFPTDYALMNASEFFAECYGWYSEKEWYPGFLDKKTIQWFDRRMGKWFPHLEENYLKEN